ncbi:hypothetical protein F5Y09DRAFT_304947 [Xylaria sp. FL1042]|nr:hypothetical protein F5Y09DRAFT_304947 [Xylaria sp. FL1042]
MRASMAQCRGFAHPLVLLVRSTLRARSSLESFTRITTSSPCLLLTSHSPNHQRHFSSSRAHFKSIKTPKTTAKAPTTASKPTANKPPAGKPVSDRVRTTTSNLSYAQRLAMRPNPTTLYEAASQTGFLVSSYGAAQFCLGCAGINGWLNVFNLPPGLSPWVPVGFGVISFVFACIGTLFAMRPSSIIRSIKVLPYSPAQRQLQEPLPESVTVEVTARRIAPIPLPLKRIQVRPEQITLVNRMQYRAVVLSEEERAAERREEAIRRKKEREYELDHLMTAPFRDAGKASSALWINVRRGLTGEGFEPVFINGVQYKLDTDGGYALENGQVLDRLVKFQPDPQLARLQSENKKEGW